MTTTLPVLALAKVAVLIQRCGAGTFFPTERNWRTHGAALRGEAACW